MPVVYQWYVYNVFTGRFVGSYSTPEQATMVAETYHQETNELHRVVRA